MKNQIDWLEVGESPLREELQKKASRYMRFTGYLRGDSLAEIYSDSNLLIFPSPTETFGNVVLEALASGIPVISANAGGVMNIIHPEVTGGLCSPRNIGKFIESIQKLLENDGKRLEIGIEGKKYASTQNGKNFD